VPTSAERFCERLPYALGDSPWEIEGAGYLFHDEYVRDHIPGGAAAVRSQLGALADHPVWSRLRLASGSYDLLPLVVAGHACADALGMGFEPFVQLRARHQAERDMTVLRRVLLSVLSPAMVAKRFPYVVTSYFNFSTPGAEVIERGVRVWVRGVPAIVGPWMRATCHGFVEHALAAAGARELQIAPELTPVAADAAGHAHVDLSFELRWR
jgi:hypothetical protein